MTAKPLHVFDDATQITAGDGRWRGRTNPDYWAFVGPFGGFTAATILRAIIEHPQRTGETRLRSPSITAHRWRKAVSISTFASSKLTDRASIGAWNCRKAAPRPQRLPLQSSLNAVHPGRSK
jgi:hypothetical protein